MEQFLYGKMHFFFKLAKLTTLAEHRRCSDNNHCERVGKYRQNCNWTKRRPTQARQVAQKIETYV